jgi:serine/threonine protein kinase
MDPWASKEDNNEALRNFLQQAEILKNFNHSHILKFVERFDMEGDHYVVTEFIDGKNFIFMFKVERSRIA